MAFTYKLEHEDGTPADPPTFRTAVPTWKGGDTIPLGRDRRLRVIEVRPGSDSGTAARCWWSNPPSKARPSANGAARGVSRARLQVRVLAP